MNENAFQELADFAFRKMPKNTNFCQEDFQKLLFSEPQMGNLKSAKIHCFILMQLS